MGLKAGLRAKRRAPHRIRQSLSRHRREQCFARSVVDELSARGGSNRATEEEGEELPAAWSQEFGEDFIPSPGNTFAAFHDLFEGTADIRRAPGDLRRRPGDRRRGPGDACPPAADLRRS